MNEVVIKVENLGKKYTIGHNVENGRYVALRDVLMHNTRMLWNKTKDLARGKPIIQGETLEEIWALKNVSFEINRGEAVGIIGRNGAGKSTLLKILSRITEPSEGRVTIKGRVASLLEVGTGFHPELTGRENIYLNGTILGMTRKEIKQKFDEIVDFAEIDKFLDTPVKRFSSGMYVRLAFAVAAHLEPNILIVDEVLAVGDTMFQKKCLGKMGKVATEGRTVLFVSHNMRAIQDLCGTSILLNKGYISKIGNTAEIISLYQDSNVYKRKNETISVSVIYDNKENNWKVGEKIEVIIKNTGSSDDFFVDLAFYNENRSKLFSLEGCKFALPLKLKDFLKVDITNPGLVNSIIYIDIGLKKHFLDGYCYLEKNVAEIKTEQLSGIQPINGMVLPSVSINYE
jgi:ABC-type polysaccharide/polyol phosphate transport system ATPase subunit